MFLLGVWTNEKQKKIGKRTCLLTAYEKCSRSGNKVSINLIHTFETFKYLNIKQ